jgi:hypothetical protein
LIRWPRWSRRAFAACSSSPTGRRGASGRAAC